MKFNKKAIGIKIVNRAGGQAYIQNPKLELISLLLTSFLKNKFYESEGEQLERLKNLVFSIQDKKFIAKSAIYARTKFGMRSITHALAGELINSVKKEQWIKEAIAKIVYRPDDMMEILSYHIANYGKPIPNNLKKGLAIAIEKFDEYQLAKYKGEGKSIKLVDIVNISHPKPLTEERAKLYKDLLTGNLKLADTWEVKLTQAGQKAKDNEEKVELKKEVWKELILEKKIGYFALLRNLRNILEQADEYVDNAIQILIDEKLIKKSLVLPFRFQTAINEIQQTSFNKTRNVLIGLIRAMDISLGNVPVFEGKTLVVLDVSGSMEGKPVEIGSLFASALYRTNNADFMMFDEYARYSNLNPIDSIYSISQSIQNMATGGGTDFHTIFKAANKSYNRIIVLSDMQGWIGYDTPVAEFNLYKSIYNCNPFIYSFDLNGYGDMQLPEQNVFCITGFSDKVFDLIKLLESDKNAIISEIEKIEL